MKEKHDLVEIKLAPTGRRVEVTWFTKSHEWRITWENEYRGECPICGALTLATAPYFKEPFPVGCDGS